jgi:hypothetical protein
MLWDVSLMHLPRSTSQEDLLVFIFVIGWVNPRAMVRLKELCKLNDPIGNRTRDLLACSIAPQHYLPLVASLPFYYSDGICCPITSRSVTSFIIHQIMDHPVVSNPIKSRSGSWSLHESRGGRSSASWGWGWGCGPTASSYCMVVPHVNSISNPAATIPPPPHHPLLPNIFTRHWLSKMIPRSPSYQFLDA